VHYKKSMLQLLHKVTHPAGPSISVPDCEGVPAVARTSGNRNLRYEQVTVVMLDTDSRAALITRDPRLCIESTPCDGEPYGPAHDCIAMYPASEEPLPS
jgi:hypothetical protein